MRVLVTGGAGFIGSNYVRRIFDGTLSGISSVLVLDKLTYAGVLDNLDSVKNESKFEFFQGDIADSRLVTELIDQVDAVVNFAAESHVDRSITNSRDFIDTNVVGVQVILDAIKASKRQKRLLQVSTDEVYGSIESGSWNESSPLLPNSPYSATKAAGELIARAYHRTHNLDVVITRCSNNYGPYHFPEKLIPLSITNLIEGKKIQLYGNGQNIRDWLHVDDHCLGIHHVLMGGKSGETYNIGGGLELTNLEITHKILQIMGLSDNNIEYVEDRKGHDLRYSIDWRKISQQLHYEPKIDFTQGLNETILWYQNNEQWWKPLKNR
jgi:dTDP-glucose 4,6-dehydratase